MQIKLLSFSQSEMCIELRPRPSSSENASSNELEPLKLSVTWSPDERFRLQVAFTCRCPDPRVRELKLCIWSLFPVCDAQVNEGTAGLVEECMSGRRSELSAALLEVMQTYVGQAGLLTEVQALRSRWDKQRTQQQLYCIRLNHICLTQCLLLLTLRGSMCPF